MKLGIHVSDFTWPNGQSAIPGDLAKIAVAAEQAGFDRLSVMDHFWQIKWIGAPEQEMLEAYTTLGYLAAKTETIKLLTLVTGVSYRDPGLLAKAVTTLDVLSGGRAMLGLGAAWYEEEASGLGLFFPSLSERYERLDEVLAICLQMWSDSDAPFNGKYYQLERTLNSPQAVSSPHPPILIGGSGEKKTLRLVAKYAQSCNLFNGPELAHKLDVLRAHCDEFGRDYDEIEKTISFGMDVGDHGEKVEETIDALGTLSELGFTVAHGAVKGVATIEPLHIIGEKIVPIIAAF